MTDSLKTCTKCGETKPLSDFGLLKGRRRPDCKACVNAYCKRRMDAQPNSRPSKLAERNAGVIRKDGIVYLPLTHGKCAIVDEEDLPKVLPYLWTAYQCYGRRNWYVKRVEGGRVIHLHRAIIGAAASQFVDHKNGDGLDNRKENLRIATTAQNLQNRPAQRTNTTGFKGVREDKRRGTFSAAIQANRQRYFLGAFKAPAEAARAYDEAAKQYHGEFACLNFPELEEGHRR